MGDSEMVSMNTTIYIIPHGKMVKWKKSDWFLLYGENRNKNIILNKMITILTYSYQTITIFDGLRGNVKN